MEPAKHAKHAKGEAVTEMDALTLRVERVILLKEFISRPFALFAGTPITFPGQINRATSRAGYPPTSSIAPSSAAVCSRLSATRTVAARVTRSASTPPGSVPSTASWKKTSAFSA